MPMVFEKLIDYHEFIELILNNIKSKLKTIKNKSPNSVIIENINIVNTSQNTLKSKQNKKTNNYPTLDLNEDLKKEKHKNLDKIDENKKINNLRK